MSKRYLRQEMLLGREAMEKLAGSHVAVFGVGGVGSWCAEALARAGIGTLTLVDEDSVSETNINRQIEALVSTVGEGKAGCMARRIADISPDTRVFPVRARYEASSREDFFAADYDYIVDAIDLVSCKVDLIVTALNRKVPIVSALGTGNKLDAQRLRLCDIAETSGCPFARVVRRELRRRGVEHHAVVFSPEEALAPEQAESPPPGRRSVPGSAVWVPACAGLLLAQHVVRQIAGV